MHVCILVANAQLYPRKLGNIFTTSFGGDKAVGDLVQTVLSSLAILSSRPLLATVRGGKSEGATKNTLIYGIGWWHTTNK